MNVTDSKQRGHFVVSPGWPPVFYYIAHTHPYRRINPHLPGHLSIKRGLKWNDPSALSQAERHVVCKVITAPHRWKP